MLVVAALGGNALLRRGQPPDIETERTNIKMAVEALAHIAREHRLVVTHGNGPQVGLLARQGESVEGVAPYPLDVLDAGTEGMIGYLIESELRGALVGKEVATLLTQVVVDPNDPAFKHPTKPIGGLHTRRLVASPEPKRILEIETIALLVDVGAIVVCAGGGGIPVAIDDAGRIRGVEAVIDKDASAALLAIQLHADALLLLTDVPGVMVGPDLRRATPIGSAPVSELRAMTFEAGSMGPKVDAACSFVEQTGKLAGIGALGDAPRILACAAGTIVRPG